MPAASPKASPLAIALLVLAVLVSPSVLIAGAVQIAVAVDGTCLPAGCFAGGR